MMLSKTENYYTYIIDDAYIHLAIAKNFALHDVWGMTPYKFSSSSSSPIFTFILSVFISVFGNNELYPLFFNILCGFLIIVFLNKYYARFFSRRKSIIFANLFTLFFAVLHLQILLGMEHVLQVFIIVVNIFYFYQWSQSEFKNKISAFWFYFTIAFLGLIRFESMFYFVSFAFVFLLIKKIKPAIFILLFGFVPILIFGYFNYGQTGYFFPNSVIVKGTQFSFSGDYFRQLYRILFQNMFLNITFYKVGIFPLLMAIILIHRDYKNKKKIKEIVSENFLILVLGLTLILQSMFGGFKGTFRYEAYILTGFSMAIIPKLKSFFASFSLMPKKEKMVGFIIVFTFLLMIYKFGFAHLMITKSSANIYEQQIQSAKFLKKYYNTSKVVANDIGAICYFSDIHLMDIAGLGSVEMIPFNLNKKKFDDDFENYLTQYCAKNKYELAVVYEEWLGGHVPKNWKKVAILKINNKMNVAIDHVTIYSIDPKIHGELKQNVKKFDWNKNVEVRIFE